ncbi:hypothetical protein Tco_0736822 [Tanacetum coccineum]
MANSRGFCFPIHSILASFCSAVLGRMVIQYNIADEIAAGDSPIPQKPPKEHIQCESCEDIVFFLFKVSQQALIPLVDPF